MSFGQAVKAFGVGELRTAVIGAYPHLGPSIGESDGVHYIVSALAREAMASIAANDTPTAVSIAAFLDDILGRNDVDSEIYNAASISFLSVDELRSSVAGKVVLSAMPDRIAGAICATGTAA